MVLTAGLAEAQGDREVLCYVNSNTSVTSYATTRVSTSTIIPGKHRMLGYTICPLTGDSKDSIVAFYDADTVGEMTSSTIFSEAEAPVGQGSETVIFPYPKRISDGVAFYQGTESVVTIYYERYHP